MSGSRGKRRDHAEDEHEEHVNHEAWVIPYADILTLLMALFLVLFAIGRTDQDKLELAAESFRRELGGSSPLDLGAGTGGSGPLADGGSSVLDGAGPAPIRSDTPPDAPSPPTTVPADEAIRPPRLVVVPGLDDAPLTEEIAEAVDEALAEGEQAAAGGAAGEVAGDPLSEVERVVRERAEGTGLADTIGFRREARGLVVTIVTDRVLFDEGEATIQPTGSEILEVVADALRELPNAVVIEGHTDSRPIATARYASNWELSTARAISVLRHLVEQAGFDATRLSAAGYADTRPIDSTGTPEAMARNRRVEIVVLATVS